MPTARVYRLVERAKPQLNSSKNQPKTASIATVSQSRLAPCGFNSKRRQRRA